MDRLILSRDELAHHLGEPWLSWFAGAELVHHESLVVAVLTADQLQAWDIEVAARLLQALRERNLQVREIRAFPLTAYHALERSAASLIRVVRENQMHSTQSYEPTD